MKAYLDCLPCLLSQALKAARAVTDDEDVHRQVLDAVAGIIPNLSLGLTPPEIAQQGYRVIYEIIRDSDPFRKAKAEANQTALALYPHLKKVLADSQEPLLTACKLAIAGNSIDFGPDFHWGNINDIVKIAPSSPLAIDNYDKLRDTIRNSRQVLYLGDNAGEIVFDRLLIEEIHRTGEVDATFVVRDRPIINDATLDDALTVGMDKVAKIISSGSDAPATILSQCSPELLKMYYSADVIIAKGQGNYEALAGEDGNVFFLLRAKCPVLAESLGVQVGDAMLKQQPARGASNRYRI